MKDLALIGEYKTLIPNQSRFLIPSNGKLITQFIGDGTVVNITINQSTGSLNSGVTLSNGALYEFEFSVLKGDSVVISDMAALVRVIMVWDGGD
jgi:hypothetical protein